MVLSIGFSLPLVSGGDNYRQPNIYVNCCDNDRQATFCFIPTSAEHNSIQVYPSGDTLVNLQQQSSRNHVSVDMGRQRIDDYQLLMLKDERGNASPVDLINYYYRSCQDHEHVGAQLLREATHTQDYKKLEHIISETSKALRTANSENDTFCGSNLYFDECDQSRDKAVDNYYDTLRVARTKWNDLAKKEAFDWAEEFDKRIDHGKSVDEMIHDCIKNAAVETKHFKQTVYEHQLAHIKDYKLQAYEQNISKLSPGQLEKAYADSCARQATLEKTIKNHVHSAKGNQKGCALITRAKFEVDLENEKQDLLLERIAKRGPEKSAKDVASNSSTKTTLVPAPSTKTALSPLSDRAKEYAQQSGLPQDTINQVGNDAIESLAAIAEGASTSPNLVALKTDLEKSGINSIDMMTGNDSCSLREPDKDILKDGITEGLELTVMDIKGLGALLNDARICTMAFLDNPLQEGFKLGSNIAEGTANVAKNIVNSADHFASQFTGDYSRLNELLANEPQEVKNYYHNLITGLEKGSCGLMSSKSIETLVGTAVSIQQLPDNIAENIGQASVHMWENFNNLSPQKQIATITHQISSFAFCEGLIGAATKSVQIAKASTILATKVVAKVVPKAEAILTGLTESARGAEEAALAGIQGKIPIPHEKDLANNTFHQWSEAPRSNAAKVAINQGKSISLTGYDTSLGNLKKLEEAANMFKNNPSALAKDGPLTKILENGKAKSSVGNLATARGAGYELEKAYDLTKAGEEVLGFGQKIGGREFDIETTKKLIECKNWDWTNVSLDRIKKLKSGLPQIQKIAQARGKMFEFHSKHSIPEDLKTWLKNKNISFKEG